MSTPLQALVDALRASRGFAHKRDIAAVLPALDDAAPAGVPNGDDCAVLPLPAGLGYQLLAIEGLVPDFVAALPWFAGYSAVMVNLSDIAAMGGRATGVVDALWARDEQQAGELLAGMRAAAERYGVPLLGGHTNLRAKDGQLAVAVLGHAKRLISSFDARPGERLLAAVDLRGRWQGEHPFWNASTDVADAARLRGDLALLPELAEAGLVRAGKDISMAGVLGSLLMLLECSGVGARVDLTQLPRPEGAAWLRWLCAFPSYGFVLSVAPACVADVQARFAARGLACADIGGVEPGTRLRVALDGEEALLWDLAEAPFIGARPAGLPTRTAA
ncbi:sll0787 family AIR synthase-like protein [Paucibacter sp. R3-3]|uniref:Sll0787 family AIR synthase-like protein n=1 Tax=Roseateles agri TaxID=3098619 RepID=A0ABU5DSZ2_9BURK|nr:sll0787 family AIR synthase-like protein [Paucibacter sp. R3-3]MDY0748951.1 sll0787 family AIR synthase-like protein [Paucibacter sp. R3-3]